MAGLTSTLSNTQGSSNRPLFVFKCARYQEGDLPRNLLRTFRANQVMSHNELGSFCARTRLVRRTVTPKTQQHIPYIRILSALVGSRCSRFSRGLIKVLQHLTNNTHTMNTIIHILNITIHKLTRLRDRLVNRNIEKFLNKCNKNNTYIEMRGM